MLATVNGHKISIEPGIKGIRKFLANAGEHTGGWHVYVGDAYMGFQKHSAAKILVNQSWAGNTFVGWTGNGLSFRKGN